MGSEVVVEIDEIAAATAPAAQTPAQVATATAPYPTPTPSTTETPDVTPTTVDKDVAGTLLEIVAEKTGYPAEMVDSEMDLEADLGIDSIKRVEIMSALRDRIPSVSDADPETMGELRSLGEIGAYLSQTVQGVTADPKG